MDQLQKMCKGKKGVTSANAIAIKNDIEDGIEEEFKESFANLFDGEIFSSSNIVSEINSWVKKKTNGMIQNIADDSML